MEINSWKSTTHTHTHETPTMQEVCSAALRQVHTELHRPQNENVNEKVIIEFFYPLIGTLKSHKKKEKKILFIYFKYLSIYLFSAFSQQ